MLNISCKRHIPQAGERHLSVLSPGHLEIGSCRGWTFSTPRTMQSWASVDPPCADLKMSLVAGSRVLCCSSATALTSPCERQNIFVGFASLSWNIIPSWPGIALRPVLNCASLLRDSREWELPPSSWCSDGTGALPKSPWVPLFLPKSASAQEVGCIPGSGLATSTCSRCEHSIIPSASRRTVWGATVCLYHSPLVTCCDLFTGFLVLLVTPGWDRAPQCQHHSTHRASGIHLPYDFQGLCSFLRHCISLKIHKLCSLKLLKSIPLPLEGFCWVAFDFIETHSLYLWPGNLTIQAKAIL